MKLLLPLSSNAFPEAALALALETARRHGGEILAVFIVDRDGIRRQESGAPPGAIHLALEAEKRIAEHEEAEGRTVLREVASRCAAAEVPCHAEIASGNPRHELEKASARCDLLVAAADSRFAYDEADAPGELVLSLMKKGLIPVLLSVSRPAAMRTVVVGCGGGERTARAVGAMARLGLWKRDCRLILMTVAESAADGEARLTEPRRILAEADYALSEEKILRGPKLETFELFCAEADADVAVLGGLGEHRWDDLVGRSVTGHLIAEGRHHLFLYM